MVRRVQSENNAFEMVWELDSWDQVNEQEYMAIQNGALPGVRPLYAVQNYGSIFLRTALPKESTIREFKDGSLNNQSFLTCILSLAGIAIGCIQNGFRVDHLCWREDCIFVRKETGSCSMLYFPVDSMDAMEGNMLQLFHSFLDVLDGSDVSRTLAESYRSAVYQLQNGDEYELNELTRNLREAYRLTQQEEAQRRQEEQWRQEEAQRRQEEQQKQQKQEAIRRQQEWLQMQQGGYGWLESIQNGVKIQLSQNETTIGRRDCTVVIAQDASVSRQHAKIIRRGSEFFITDLGSRNGTYVGGFRLAQMEEVLLESGAELRLGRTRFVFYCE